MSMLSALIQTSIGLIKSVDQIYHEAQLNKDRGLLNWAKYSGILESQHSLMLGIIGGFQKEYETLSRENTDLVYRVRELTKQVEIMESQRLEIMEDLPEYSFPSSYVDFD